MNNKEIVMSIINYLGNKDNLLLIENCMTRIRIDVKNLDKCNLEELKKTTLNFMKYFRILLMVKYFNTQL